MAEEEGKFLERERPRVVGGGWEIIRSIMALASSLVVMAGLKSPPKAKGPLASSAWRRALMAAWTSHSISSLTSGRL